MLKNNSAKSKKNYSPIIFLIEIDFVEPSQKLKIHFIEVFNEVIILFL